MCVCLRFGLKPFSKITFFVYILLYGNLNKNPFLLLLLGEGVLQVVALLVLISFFCFPLYRLYLNITHLLREIVEILNKSIISWLAYIDV